MTATSSSIGNVASTRPPAKLNLFLELLARRDDGYHEIDTVMVPIAWSDQMRIRSIEAAEIKLSVDWLPSREITARRLGLDLRSQSASQLLDIPCDESNLVYRSLQRFIDRFGIGGGFECELGKRIPAGAGMGGASSDAASALRCAASLCGIPTNAPELVEIGESIGSDVPFFLGVPSGATGDNTITAARAQGRGENLSPIKMTTRLHCVVIYPGVSLSTGKVYADSRVPQVPQTSCRLIDVLGRGELGQMPGVMMNRLEPPAKKLAPQINEIIESLWRMGLRTCQLTGSGSACFAIASSPSEAQRMAARMRAMFEPGAIVAATTSTTVPAPVEMT